MILQVNSTKLKKQITPIQIGPGNRKEDLLSNWYKACVTLIPKSDKVVNKEKWQGISFINRHKNTK